MSETGRNGSATIETNAPDREGEGLTKSHAEGSKVVILVDASNVAHGRTSAASQPRLDYLQRALAHLNLYPVRVVTLADASLRHKIDRQAELEDLFKSGQVEQVPAGTGADDFLWQLWKRSVARGERAYILTNDLFPTKNARDESLGSSPRIAFFFLGEDLILEPAIETLIGPSPLSEAKPSSKEPAPPAARNSELTPAVGPGHSVDSQTSSQTRPERSESRRETGVPFPSTSATQEPDQLNPDIAELIDAAVRVVANYTEPPNGRVRRVNFATVAHLLHNEYGGDFVAKFGMRRPKDLAMRMAEDGLLTVSFKEATMYVEPTPRLESLIERRALPRRSTLVIEEPTSSAPKLSPPPPVVRAELDTSKVTLPPTIEASAGAPAPVVEVASPDLFLRLVQDHQPKHLFHWSSKVNVRRRWRLEGEFFFVSNGTAFRLPGRGYKNIADFLDGREHGFDGADSEDRIGDLEEGYIAYDLWQELLEFKGFDRVKDRPSEGDVYYYARSRGFSNLQELLNVWTSNSKGVAQRPNPVTEPRPESPGNRGAVGSRGGEARSDYTASAQPQTHKDKEELMRELLAYLLMQDADNRRFETSQNSTEFGIAAKFPSQSADTLREALRALEHLRMVYRRTQYVVGYSEAKHVYALTPGGHRAALVAQRGDLPSFTTTSTVQPTRNQADNDDYPDDDDVPPSYDDDDNPAVDWVSDND